ncbi:MAG: hypothetical protein HYR63_02310 [Proteobacteria bacterium]|nr:hypothetical protein [Pseudomonadota bacterium]MBI3498386.1 hypothetical protein [Pseudomonadota bacterium]
MLRTLMTILVLALLAGCTSEPPPARLPEMTFTNLPKIMLEVALVEVVDKYNPPFASPNVEHKMPVPPARVARRWAEDRLLAAGDKGRALVTIQDAKVIEVSLKRSSSGLTGAFTTEQGKRYDASLEMSVEIVNDRGFKDAAATARAVRSQTVAEDISPNKLDEVWYEMVEALMRDINAELERNMRQFMGRYIRQT